MVSVDVNHIVEEVPLDISSEEDVLTQSDRWHLRGISEPRMKTKSVVLPYGLRALYEIFKVS